MVKKWGEKPEEQPVETTTTPVETEKEMLQRETELLELKARHEEANSRLKVAKAGYAKVSDLLAREAGIIDKETELEAEASELVRTSKKNAEILAKIADAKVQVREEVKEVAKIKAINDKAKDFVANLTLAHKADGVTNDLNMIEKFFYSHQPDGLRTGDVRDRHPQLQAFYRIKKLLEGG